MKARWLLALVAACGTPRPPATAPVTTITIGSPPEPPLAITVVTTDTTTERPKPEAGELVGTVWVGSETVTGGPLTLDFRKDGLLVYTTQSGTWDNGRWKQDGSTVLWDTNNHYADYEGTITGGRMEGSAHNKPGESWTWSVEKR
jgi:hypothetical protein